MNLLSKRTPKDSDEIVIPKSGANHCLELVMLCGTFPQHQQVINPNHSLRTDRSSHEERLAINKMPETVAFFPN